MIYNLHFFQSILTGQSFLHLFSFQTDWRMFKYLRPEFYKDFLSKTSSCSATKIQAVVRGHQTRRKYKKGGIGKKSRV